MRISSMVAIATLVVWGASKAWAEAAAGPDAPKPTVAAKADDQPARVGAVTETAGKVIALHNVSLVGRPDPHVLVKIQTEQGETDIVDLGTAADLKSGGIEAHEGQQLWVTGRVGRINDKELIVAECVSESKTLTVYRSGPLREESEKHAAAAGKDSKDAKATVDPGMVVRTIEGAVLNTTNLKVEGEPEAHVLAKLQTEHGIVVVDLGLASALPKVDLSEGQSVAVTGFVAHLNGKPIILADMVGNLSSIKRPAAASATPAKNPVADK